MASLVRSIRHLNVLNTSFAFMLQQNRNYRAQWVAPTLRALKKNKLKEIEKNGGVKITHRSTFLEWNYDAELYAFSNRLGEMFDDTLLRRALTHKSYIVRESERLKDVGIEAGIQNLTDNEELVVEGKRLLEKHVAGYLRVVFNKAPEECIEAIRNHLISEKNLAEISRHLGISDLMLCADFPPEETTLAKSLEAVISALQKSSGEERARDFIHDFILTQLYAKDIQEIWNPTNPMGILKDILQRAGRGEPEPRLLRRAGVNTILSAYCIGIYSDRQLLGSAFGESTEIAQEMAARDALRRLFDLQDNSAALPLGRQLRALKQQTEEAAFKPNPSLDQWSSKELKNIISV